MSLQPEHRRKLSRALTAELLAGVQQELTENALMELATSPLPAGGLEALTAEAVLRLRGIDYVCRQLAGIGIEPAQPGAAAAAGDGGQQSLSLSAGGGTDNGNGAGRAANSA